jgi:transposase
MQLTIIEQNPKGKIILLILDNARYHHANMIQPWFHKNKQKIELLFLPPYSPELNPAELIWKYFRYLVTYNRYFPTLENLIDDLGTKLQDWDIPNSRLQLLYTLNFVV